MEKENNSPRKKALGAARQIANTVEKDMKKEAALSEGLDRDHIFLSAARGIDKERRQLISSAKKKLRDILVPEAITTKKNSSLWERFMNILIKEKPVRIYIESRPGYPTWKTIRNFFKQQAEELGYEGDMDDWESLERWAETLVAKSLDASRKVPAMISKKRSIRLERRAGAYLIKVRRARKNLTKR